MLIGYKTEEEEEEVEREGKPKSDVTPSLNICLVITPVKWTISSQAGKKVSECDLIARK